MSGPRAGRDFTKRKNFQATRGAQTFRSFIHGAEKQVLAACCQAEARTFGDDEFVQEFSQRAERFIGRSPREPSRKSRRPAAQMLTQEFPLRVAAQRALVLVQLVFVRV